MRTIPLPSRLMLLTVGCLVYLNGWALLRIPAMDHRAGALLGLALLDAALLLARFSSELSTGRVAISVGLTVVGCSVVTGQLPVAAASIADAWFTSTTVATALVLAWRRQSVGAGAVLVLMVLGQWLWGGPQALEAIGSVTSGLVVAMAAAGIRALEWFRAESDRYAAQERAELEHRAVQDAYRTIHQQRLEQTGALASDMLQRIIDSEGRLVGPDRTECRVLHQSIRDETRGRHLLNDRLRAEILRHRRRGAVVQVLDDGDVEDLAPHELSDVLDQVAEAISALHSDRIVIRSAPRGSDFAITVIATSTDPIAEALGLDTGDDDGVDLWLQFPRVESSLRSPADAVVS